MEIVASFVGKIGDYLFGAIGSQLGYLVHYNDNIGNLKKEAEKLKDMRERVGGRIYRAERNGEDIEADVRKWETNVDAIILQAGNFLEDEGNADKRCLKGWCINLSSRYRLSKEAEGKTAAIAELYREGNFQTVSHPPPPPGIIAPSSKNVGAFESRRSVMKKIIEALHDKNVHIIGVCGMGGVGKTTLVKEIGKQVKEELFEDVVMTVVSQPINVKKIQDGIAGQLGMQLDDRRSDSERAQSLWERIRRGKRILVILDDIWSRLDLEVVGIPFGEDCMSCKIVLTSRSQDVCNAMEAQKIIPVGVLSKEEAWLLFREKAGEAVDTNELNHIAREVANECAGLPIAIETVGRALKPKSKDVWASAAQELKKSAPTNIPGMIREVFPKLELSYNYLESEEAKSVFLLCCLFPEDYDIPVEVLVRYGIGLKVFQDVDSVEEARGKAHTAVSTLIASFLLLESDKGDEDFHFVRMHDVVRDVAISIASKDKNMFLVKPGGGLREWPDQSKTFENYTGISLMSNNIRELPQGLECPKLQTLMLQANYLSTFPNNFYEGMTELKVLDMSHVYIDSLPPSLTLLTTLRTLCLNNSKLGDISVLGGLKKLEILSLSGSDIREVPAHISQLTNLKMFDLTGCEKLSLIVPGVISSLLRLEELYIGDSFLYWEIEEEGKQRSNASLMELKSLTRLTGLHCCMPKADCLPSELHLQNLSRFVITVGNDGKDGYFYYLCLRVLRLTLDMKIPLLGWIKELLRKTESLVLNGFKDLENILKDLNSGGFNDLKFLQLEHCDDMKYLVDTTEWAPEVAFRSLENLSIIEQQNFSQICRGQLPPESFSNLRCLQVCWCDKMLNVVPSNLLLRLKKLEKLDVIESRSLGYVFVVEGLVVEERQMGLLSVLKELMLRRLDELVDIWKGPHQLVTLCSLKNISVEGCGKLTRLFSPTLVEGLVHLEKLAIDDCNNLEEVFGTLEEKEEMGIVAWKNDPGRLPCLLNLTHVSISFCGKLRNLFSPSIAKGLAQLKQLDVNYCKNMQEIIGDEKGEETIEKMVFPRLYKMKLDCLKRLKSFCPGRHTIEWPSLEELDIVRCPKMVTFGCGVQVTPKLKGVTIERVATVFPRKRQIWMGDLNATVQQIFKREGVLSKEAAWVLFREMAGEAVDTNELNPIARDVANECGCLPIAIKTVGRALKTKSKEVWVDAARQLKKSAPTNISEKIQEVFPKVELSYNYLESEEAKSVFLLCCLFPEDYDIPVEVLVRYGIGLKVFQDVDSVEEARGRAHTAVSTLIDSFLLLEGYGYGNVFVKMHDVVRDVAISIASKDKNMFLVKLAGGGLRDWPERETFENYTGISLMSNYIHKFPQGLECPKLQTLLLQGNSPLTFPNNFYQGMTELKVLDMSDVCINSLPPSLTLLTTLRTLCLHTSELGDISVLGGLKKLEILSLSGSDIREVPAHISQLTNLKMFDLTGCEKLSLIVPGVISSLLRLEELYIGDSFLYREIEEGKQRSNASLMELQSLTGLHCRIPNANFLPSELHFQNLSRFDITVGNNQHGLFYNYSYLRSLTLDMKIPLLGWIKELLRKTESLHLIGFKDLENILKDLNSGGFNELKFLELNGCDDMKYLVDTMEGEPEVAFRSLEKLSITKLENFSQICRGQLPPEYFSNLRSLEVSGCHKMLNIVPSNLLLRLKKLEDLDVSHSNSLASVFEVEGLVHEEGEMGLLSMLKALELSSLDELVDIWKGPHQLVTLCSLKIISVEGCGKLTRLFSPTLVQGLVQLEHLRIYSCHNLVEVFGTLRKGRKEEMGIVAWKNDPGRLPCLLNLTQVTIISCDKLRNLFSPSIAKGLAQLKQLYVSYCKNMQEIIGDEKGEETIEKMVFPRLYDIHLQGLKSLKSFCPGRHTIEWPSLEELDISYCPNLVTFGCGVQVTPKLKVVAIGDGSQEIWTGDLNATVKQIFRREALVREEVGPHYDSHLRFSHTMIS